MPYELCVNCGQEVTDPTNPNEPDRFVHLDTLVTFCHPDDLRAAGYSRAEIDEQIRGVAGLSACPTPANDDQE